MGASLRAHSSPLGPSETSVFFRCFFLLFCCLLAASRHLEKRLFRMPSPSPVRQRLGVSVQMNCSHVL